MTPIFFQLYRKRGFSLTLELLAEFEDNEAKETDFFQKLKDSNSYLNEFYRVKKGLLEYGLVAYKLDENYDKVLFLTDKGLEVLAKLDEIEEMLAKGKKKKTKKKKK